MRSNRFLAIGLALVIAFSVAGCTKTWSIDFTKSQGGWTTLLDFDDPGITVTNNDLGLLLSGTTMVSRYGFNGDFEFTVIFKLNVSSTNTLSLFRVYLGDGADPSNQSLLCKFENMGGVSEFYAIYDSFAKVHDAMYVSGINHTGLNTFTIIKKGNTVDMLVNGYSLFEPFTITNYTAPLFVPYIYVQQGSPDEDEELLVIKSIKMKYSGDKVDL